MQTQVILRKQGTKPMPALPILKGGPAVQVRFYNKNSKSLLDNISNRSSVSINESRVLRERTSQRNTKTVVTDELLIAYNDVKVN